MINRPTFKTFSVGVTSLTLFLSACSPSSQPISANGPGLVPPPATEAQKKLVKTQLQRYRGQTEFLNVAGWGYGDPVRRGAPSEDKASNEAGGAERAEQESDVFKIGKPGSKLLYLLNQYRGLQVVSFEAGPQAPKLMGRVAPTGNHPDEMYYDAKNDRLIVLEYKAYDHYSNSSHQDASRLVIYDVASATEPKIWGAVEVPGRIADSRIVGDVLYVATSTEEKGAVYSYDLTKKALPQVAAHALDMKVSGAKNMNILTVKEADDTKYYLIATLSESGWGWWDRDSRIEVVDISDAKGEIHPVMSVAAKGRVRERSQTTIKNDTLIVTSNYFLGGQDVNGREQIARIAVETFNLPKRDSQVLDGDEAEYRKRHIDRAVKNLSGEARDKELDRLVNDAELGIRGRFVRLASGGLTKMMPDSAVTVGDGSGLSANLQDVRYQDGLLYAFWVPANEIDPFDLFDISEPEKGVKYISRLHFDGWISRAIPVMHKGRRFIIGLGWIVDVVNNENGRRLPQAMVFEIVENRGKLRAMDVAQYSFTGGSLWTDFNGQDKEIEIRVDGDGKGEILFAASRADGSGGQILGFDLEKVVTDDYDHVFRQGPFLSGGSDWVRRVFTNTEIGRINSFSDRSLATFGEKDGNSSTLSPTSILELARNLRAYETFGGKGVQIISNDYWYSDDAGTTLRLVETTRADEEKAQVRQEMALPGHYVDHILGAGNLLVLTSKYENVQNANGEWSYGSRLHLTKLVMGASGELTVLGQKEWRTQRTGEWMPIGLRVAEGYQAPGVGSDSLVDLGDGKLMVQFDSNLQMVNVSDMSIAEPQLASCGIGKEREDVSVQIVGGKVYLASKLPVTSEEYENISFTRNFVAPVSVEGMSLRCGPELNIPGELRLVSATGDMLVQDASVKDLVLETREKWGPEDTSPEYKYWRAITTNAMVSLKVKDGAAVLVDEHKTSSDIGEAFLVDGQLVRLAKSNEGPGSMMEYVSLGTEATIQVESFVFPTKLGERAQMVQVVPHPKETAKWVGLLREGNKLQAVSFGMNDKRPEIVGLIPVDERFAKSAKASALVTVPTPGYYWFGSDKAHFTPALGSFEIVQGMAGISQYVLAL